jgi:amidase
MLTIDKSNIHFSFDSRLKPCAFVKDGDSVRFECQDCYSEQIAFDGYDFSQIDMERNNPATGPVYIDGAEPGDIVRVEILAIDLQGDGCMTARKGIGVYDIDGFHCRRFKVDKGFVRFDNGINVPIRPNVGVIGTAPAREESSTQVPGRHGGNLDIRDIGVGSLLYLPVDVPGALLSMGDIHAVQGDGETVICALEISGSVAVKVDVLKNRSDIPLPFVIANAMYITIADDPSLDVCSLEASRNMHAFLVEHSDLNAAQCGMLLSLAGNLRISQVVNPRKGCIMEFPVGLAKESFQR